VTSHCRKQYKIVILSEIRLSWRVKSPIPNAHRCGRALLINEDGEYERDEGDDIQAADTACEYSHCARRSTQFGGSMLQFPVAWFAGYVDVQNTTCVPTMQRSAIRVSLNVRGVRRSITVSTNVETIATTTTTPQSPQPRWIC
jgi:hypothetical protein